MGRHPPAGGPTVAVAVAVAPWALPPDAPLSWLRTIWAVGIAAKGTVDGGSLGRSPTVGGVAIIAAPLAASRIASAWVLLVALAAPTAATPHAGAGTGAATGAGAGIAIPANTPGGGTAGGVVMAGGAVGGAAKAADDATCPWELPMTSPRRLGWVGGVGSEISTGSSSPKPLMRSTSGGV